MYDAPGIGLAAVQIGVPLRVIVMDISWRNEDGKKEPSNSLYRILEATQHDEGR